MRNIQALSSLLAAIVTLAIGASALLREGRRRTHTAFATFTFAVALYYLFSFAASYFGDPWWSWAAFWPAAFIPTSAVHFFRIFLAEPSIGGPERRPAATYAASALWGVALIYAALVRPIHREAWFHIPFAVYVFGGLYRCVLDLYLQYRATLTKVEKARILYLMVGGFVATTLALTDFLPRLGFAFPAIGNVLTILYLYFLSQSLFRYRLLDLQELIGRMLVIASLVVILSVVYGLLLLWVGGGKQQGLFVLNTVVASFVILILFEPVRSIVENAIHKWLVRERGDLRWTIDPLRRELMNILDDREMVRRTLASLEASRRVTHASIYLLDREGNGYDLAGSLGERPIEHLDLAVRRQFFDRLRGGPILLESLERELVKLEGRSGGAPEKEVQILDAIARTLGDAHASLAVPILGGERDDRPDGGEVLLGLLCLRDERLRYAFGVDDLDQLRLLAAQIAVTLENSQLYERLKERDRLAALGEMAAGLAHEIRNPLGAIKGAAQLLLGPGGEPAAAESASAEVAEFLSIIVDEVNRLNRVVSSFLDYARPYKGEAAEIDVNEVVRRSAQLLGGAGGVKVDLALGDVPRVRGDAQQLQQVFLNLGRNAIEAMPQGGKLTIRTARREPSRWARHGAQIEVRFRDTGKGIAREHLPRLFIPFFTTKDKGTGLGLPISQRIVTHHGGKIEVRSEPGKGSTFTVLLPLAGDMTATTTGSLARAALERR